MYGFSSLRLIMWVKNKKIL